MTAEDDPDDVLDALLPGVARVRGTVVVAPHGTVNTGTVHGDQRYAPADSPAPGGLGLPPVRQGPVRAKELRAARAHFVPPAGYTDALEALGSGVLFLVGAPGTGRQTLALNLLAHECADPALVQVDGTVDLAHWRPRPHGTHGFLVMNLADPLALRPWDIERLERELEEAGARMVVVLRETPGLARALEERLGVCALRHRPPHPGKVFARHFARLCPDPGERARRRRRVGPAALAALLPPGLPPGKAVRVAEALSGPGPAGRVTAAALTARLAAAEAARLLSGADTGPGFGSGPGTDGDPVLPAHLFAVCVHRGLDRDTVLGRAADLLDLVRADRAAADPAETSPRTTRGVQAVAPAVLAAVGARCTVREDGDGTVDLLWPAVGEAVWDVVCRERTEWLPLLHRWLGTAADEVQAEHAARALSALAARTAGRSLGLVEDLVGTGPWTAVEVAGLALAAQARLGRAAAPALALLEAWSHAPEPACRAAVLAACRPDAEALPAETALRLLRQVLDALVDDADPTPTAMGVSATLVRRFATGSAHTRQVMVRHLAEWAAIEDLPGLVAVLTVPALVAEDPGWYGELLTAGQEGADQVAALVCHALDEAMAYPAMRDTLLTWCAGAAGTPERERQLDELFARLVRQRNPGSLRLLRSIDRAGDTTPGKALAERSLAEWRAGAVPEGADQSA
ncbi:hypothetical protein ACWCV9_12460 [Streptomyces sp. NPDC001606]